LVVRPERLIYALKRLKSGSLSGKARDTDIVKVSAVANEIIIDLQNLEIVKEILGPFRKLGVLSTGGEEKEEDKSVVEKLKMIKGFAENLREERMTISIRRMGESVLVIGERAKPRLSKLVLGSSIQANILKIISLMGTLR
jgi:hypothetical protein